MLARAFRDSPLNVAVIGADPQRRLRANLAGALALLPVAVVHARVLGIGEGGRSPGHGALGGVLVATPAFGWPLPPPPPLDGLRRLLRQGLRVTRRWSQVYRALARVHPSEPHGYLATLGVDPDLQRRGLGSTLLARFLRDVAGDALPAWLETDRAENVPFYQRAGFDVERELLVLGTRVWCMRRPAARIGGDRG